MSEQTNSFDILKVMGQRNLDIRGFNLYQNMVHIQICGKGKNEYGKLTLTIDPNTAQQLMNDSMSGKSSLIGMLVVADRNQFESVKKDLTKEGEPS